MNKTVKTIIIGATITITVLFLTLFGLYKIMDTKEPTTNETNTNTYNTNTSRSITNENETNTEDNSVYKENTESTKDNENTEENTTEEEENTTTENTTNDIITIYMFKGDGCPHCEDATKYFESIKNDLKNIEVISYEVWYNSNNKELMQNVADKLNIEVSGVPFFVIGSYATTGFDTGDKLINTAQELLKDKDYKDIVKEVLEDNKIDAEGKKITN